MSSRRKVLLLGSVIISGVAIFSSSLFGRKRNKTVKMLTQNGELVEVDVNRIAANKGKASKQQLQSWIKR